MVWFAAAFLLLALTLFWGVGATHFLMPRRYRRFWPAFCLPVGMAFQSLVVWAGAWAGMSGTDRYAWFSLVLPAVLLALAWRPEAGRRVPAWVAAGRHWWGVGLLMAACVLFALGPVAGSQDRLTTVSLGSCDPADYAAGARVLMEFSRGERGGFLGLTEVVAVHSADNFYAYWLRLNYFTPAALLALNGSILGIQPYEAVTLFSAAILAALLPSVYFLARSLTRLPPGGALFVAALVGLGPIHIYGIYHGAIGQMIAAGAIAMLSWGAIKAFDTTGGWRRQRAFLPFLAVAFSLILGSYNFILLIALAPAGAYAAGRVVFGEAAWAGLFRWALLLGAALAGAALVFAERVLGLRERFLLFAEYDFSWPVPSFSPEGWFGVLGSAELGPSTPWVRVVLSLALISALVAALVRLRTDGRMFWVIFGLVAPVLAGYGILTLKAVLHQNHASYDAYKLLAVFYPGLLAGLCCWLRLRSAQAAALRAAVLGLAAFVLAGNILATNTLRARIENPPLSVGRDLTALRELEDLPQIESINLLIEEFWSRLWANAFLLRKPRYFALHTYEGPRPTPLRGSWDLRGGLLRVIPADPDAYVAVGDGFYLVDNRSPLFVEAAFGEGWYSEERLREETWRWSSGSADIRLHNPQQGRLPVEIFFQGRSVQARDLAIRLEDQTAWTGELGLAMESVQSRPVALAPGGSRLELATEVPPVSPSPADARLLGFAVYRLEVRVGTPPAGEAGHSAELQSLLRGP